MREQGIYQEENEAVLERYQLAIERIDQMEKEDTVREPFLDYFHRMSSFVRQVVYLYKMMEEGRYSKFSIEELQGINHSLYEDIAGEHYKFSYANPAYACEKMGKKFGKLLSFLYTDVRSIIVYAYEGRKQELTIYLELLIEVYNQFEREDEFTYKDVKRIMYDFMNDYCELLVVQRARELLDTKLSFATDIIMEADLTDLRYLYQFGDYITENEIRTANYLNGLSKEQVQAMADTYTEGYRLGFLANRLDISKKAIVNIRYPIGFERMIRYAIQNFRDMGLEPTIYRAGYHLMNKMQHLKIGYHGTSPNRQFDYDHRFDLGLFWDKALKERSYKVGRMRLRCIKIKLDCMQVQQSWKCLEKKSMRQKTKKTPLG